MPTRSVAPPCPRILAGPVMDQRRGSIAGVLARSFLRSVRQKLVSPVEAESQALQPEVGITESKGGRGTSS